MTYHSSFTYLPITCHLFTHLLTYLFTNTLVYTKEVTKEEPKHHIIPPRNEIGYHCGMYLAASPFKKQLTVE
jgi:hypothetical protein